ncbi:hypothetical protein JXO52_13885 [bacterium]|nr:hypothetical protein [bacterium]
MPRQPVLALDFDGVIADSLRECLVVSLNAWRTLSSRGDTITSLPEVDSGLEAAFRRLRPFIRTGEDYILIQMALEAGVTIENQLDFDRFAASYTDDRSTLRHAFYAARTALCSGQHERWLELNPLYPGMADLLRLWPDPDRLLIISTKRSDFIAAILTGNAISFPDDALYYAGPGHSKRSIIEALLKERSLSPGLFNFVDDQVDTLRKVAPTGVRCFLAAWGYTGSEQIRSAATAGITVRGLDAFLGEWQKQRNTGPAH